MATMRRREFTDLRWLLDGGRTRRRAFRLTTEEGRAKRRAFLAERDERDAAYLQALRERVATLPPALTAGTPRRQRRAPRRRGRLAKLKSGARR